MQRHRLDLVSLTFGLLFAGFGLAFGLGDATTVLTARWLWPSVLIVLGVVLVVGPLARSRGEPGPDGPVESRESQTTRHPPGSTEE